MTEENRPRLRIPAVHTNALAVLATLSDASFDALQTILSEPAKSVDDAPVVKQVAQAASLDEESARYLVSGLWNAEASRARYDWPTDHVAGAITDSVLALDSSVDAELLRRRLEVLIDLDALSDVAKGVDLLTDHEHVFYEARVITDVRMVFPHGEVAEAEPQTGVMVHMLRLTFGDEEGTRSIFLGLDSGDLQDLKYVIERAEAKAEVLRGIMNRAGVSMLDVVDSGGEQ